ncbi:MULTISPECIES: hypothetical protein [unclassified Psychrobacillus]|uniref:hypothetical protein n=1 Tax=unclassified Psychrobacillus TaxID=2636677 RepID=UPI0030FA25A0
MDFKDSGRAQVTLDNMKENLETIEESMKSSEDTSYLVKKLANQANELVKLCE